MNLKPKPETKKKKKEIKMTPESQEASPERHKSEGLWFSLRKSL